MKLEWSSGIPKGPALLIKEESSGCFEERTKPAESNFGRRTQQWAGEWASWSLKRDPRARNSIHNNWYSCSRTLVPSGCGVSRSDLLLLPGASWFQIITGNLDLGDTSSRWSRPTAFLPAPSFSVSLCWGCLTPPGSLFGLSPSPLTQSSSLPETFPACTRSSLKKIFLTLLSKCYQKERSTSPNQIHYPWQMCSVFRVAYIQQFSTTGQIILLSENLICN